MRKGWTVEAQRAAGRWRSDHELPELGHRAERAWEPETAARMGADVSTLSLGIPIEVPQAKHWELVARQASAASGSESPEEVSDDDVWLARRGEVPTERVRFWAPVTLKPENREQPTSGAVVNLSPAGIGCVADVDIPSGERVWASFRLGLAEQTTKFLCEVIWQGPMPAGSGYGYGLRFLSLTEEENLAVQAVVAEHAEGVAGAWPLPVLPEPIPMAPVVEPRPRRVRVMLGVLVGILLTLGAMHGAGGLATLSEYAFGQDALPSVPVAVPAQVARPPAARQTASVAHAPADPPSVGDASGSVDGPRVASESPMGAAPPGQTALAESGPAARESAGSLARPVTTLKPDGTSQQMTLALHADGPVEQHVAFWLTQPRRLVVDVLGRSSGFRRIAYDIEHPLASRLRIGVHPEKVRYVIETAENVLSEIEAVATGNKLVVTLHRE